jgi:hypothetical protein
MDNSFSINTENVPCGQNGVTCTKSLTIFYNGLRFLLLDGIYLFINDVLKDVNYQGYVAPGVTFVSLRITQVLVFEPIEVAIVSDGGTLRGQFKIT